MADEQIKTEEQEVEVKAEAVPEEEVAPEPLTKADIQAMVDKIAALEAKIAEQGAQEATAPDSAEIDKLYNELYGAPQTAAGADDPTAKEMRAIHKDVAELKQLQSESYKAQKRAEIDAEYAKKYAEWDGWHDDLWKFAAKHPTLSGDEVFVLVKAQKQGAESLTPKDAKAAQTAAETARKRASSEKPTTGVQGKTRETSDWDEMLKDEWGKLPDKPVFK